MFYHTSVLTCGRDLGLFLVSTRHIYSVNACIVALCRIRCHPICFGRIFVPRRLPYTGMRHRRRGVMAHPSGSHKMTTQVERNCLEAVQRRTFYPPCFGAAPVARAFQYFCGRQKLRCVKTERPTTVSMILFATAIILRSASC